MQKKDIEKLIKDLIEKITVKVNSVEVVEDKKNNTLYSVDVAEPHHFTARDGEALFALNHLIRRILEAQNPTKDKADFGGDVTTSVMVDIGGFQQKRIEGVRAVAHMMSERARYFKSQVEVDPMSAFERRIVHEFLSDAPDLKTESVGFGPLRRVVIKYVGAI
jgi:spoIIIJ-associated protein